MVTSLTGLPKPNGHESVDTSSLFYDDQLIEIMKGSLQPPHLVDDKINVPGAAFPFCHFDKENEKNSGKER